MMGGVDFPTWFGTGYYGGMACCMLAIAGNTLYTALRKKGSTHQLAAAIIVCVLSALFLLPALFWFNGRFLNNVSTISTAEVEVVLVYIAIWGWLLPLGVSSSYFLYSTPRISGTAGRLPQQRRTTREDPSVEKPPRYQPGVPVPFVYDEYTPWAWLEYRNGSFHGQRLELKRTIITMGRDENCDIWVDDELASRHHAELTYYQGHVYLTDCDSMNGIQLNRERVRGYSLLQSGDILEIGEYQFTFVLAEQKATADDNDPLAHHTWRSVEDLMGSESGKKLSLPSQSMAAAPKPGLLQSLQPTKEKLSWQETDKMSQPPLARPVFSGLVVVKDGEMAGQTFLLDRPVLTIGRGIECDIILNDTSISRQHTQLLRQAEGDYVQDLTSKNGTRLNGEILQSPRMLKTGDRILVGNIQLEYAALNSLQQTPLPRDITPPPQNITPPPLSATGGPLPLRLPSRPVPKSVE